VAHGAGKRPTKVPSPGLGLRFPIALRCGLPSPALPLSAPQNKRMAPPTVSELACVCCQCLRGEGGSARIGSEGVQVSRVGHASEEHPIPARSA